MLHKANVCPRTASHVAHPSLPEEVDPVSFTYKCMLLDTDTHFCYGLQLAFGGVDSLPQGACPVG